MFADDPDTSDLTFDPGPKHSTPIKEKPYTGIQRRDGSPALPSAGGWEKPCLPEGSKSSASVPATGKSGPRLRAARVSGSSPVHTRASKGSSVLNLPQTDRDWVVVQQRQEIASLVRELRARDGELNELVWAHQQQLGVWEQDRQLILRLQHKCQRLAAELKPQKQKSVGGSVRSAGGRRGSEDRKTQGQQNHHSTSGDNSLLHLQQLQNHNENLNDSLKEMTLAKGQLEAKEQELMTLLKLKEESAAEAEKTTGELRGQVKLLQLEKDSRQSDVQQLIRLWQQRCHVLQDDKEKLVAACQEKDRQLHQATTQLQDTLQQALVLQQALTISCEREKNKEELLTSLKARQERLYQELTQMRTLYRRQNREMTLLQLTLDTSKESDPEQSDSDKRAAHNTTRTITSLNGVSSSLSPPSASVSCHHRPSQQDQAIRTSSAHRSKTVPPKCGSSEENTDSSGDFNDVSQTVQHSRIGQQNSKTAKRSRSRGHRHSPANRANNRGAGFEYSRNHNMNNNCNVSNDPSSRAQSCSPELFHSPRQTCQPECASPHSSLHQGGQSPSPVDRDEDPDNKVQDVDTEAFWQKILSVRHGNQNNVEETKDLTPSPTKSWLTEVHNSQPLTPLLSHCQADGSGHGNQGSSERFWQKSPNPGLLKNPDSSLLLLSGTCAMTTSCPETQTMENTQQYLPSGDLRSLNLLQQVSTSPNWLSSQERGVPQEVSVLSHHDARVSLSHLQPQQSSWEQPPKSFSNEAVMNSSQQYAQQKPKAEDSQALVTQGISHSDTDAENVPGISTPFDEKLSSFLESPEENMSYDPSQGSCSPASKLYRLLMESQEMIKSLEVRVQPDPL